MCLSHAHIHRVCVPWLDKCHCAGSIVPKWIVSILLNKTPQIKLLWLSIETKTWNYGSAHSVPRSFLEISLSVDDALKSLVINLYMCFICKIHYSPKLCCLICMHMPIFRFVIKQTNETLSETKSYIYRKFNKQGLPYFDHLVTLPILLRTVHCICL